MHGQMRISRPFELAVVHIPVKCQTEGTAEWRVLVTQGGFGSGAWSVGLKAGKLSATHNGTTYTRSYQIEVCWWAKAAGDPVAVTRHAIRVRINIIAAFCFEKCIHRHVP